MTDQSLYERLGGVFAIAAVIDHFSDAVVKNKVAGQGSDNPALREWHTQQLARLPGLKFERTLWVCNVSGGPYTYVGTKPGHDPLAWKKPIVAWRSTPTNSMPSPVSWRSPWTTSRCRSGRRARSWPRSPRTRAR